MDEPVFPRVGFGVGVGVGVSVFFFETDGAGLTSGFVSVPSVEVAPGDSAGLGLALARRFFVRLGVASGEGIGFSSGFSRPPNIRLNHERFRFSGVGAGAGVEETGASTRPRFLAGVGDDAEANVGARSSVAAGEIMMANVASVRAKVETRTFFMEGCVA
jgi:hypothetical protein